MKELREFNIDIYKLKNDTFHFQFDVDKEFFEFFHFGLMKGGKAIATVEMLKTDTLINMTIAVKGVVELICDRSLELFEYPVSTKDKILFKFGDKYEEVSDEIIIIDRNTQRLNIAQHVFDFISLSIPMKKIHPKFQDEDENDDETSETKFIYSSENIDKETEENKEDLDPRWNALKNLKNNNN